MKPIATNADVVSVRAEVCDTPRRVLAVADITLPSEALHPRQPDCASAGGGRRVPANLGALARKPRQELASPC